LILIREHYRRDRLRAESEWRFGVLIKDNGALRGRPAKNSSEADRRIMRRMRRLDRSDVDLNLVPLHAQGVGWSALRTRCVTHLPLTQSKPIGDAGR